MPPAQRWLGDRPALSRCIRVAPDTFANQYWGSTPLLSRTHELPQNFDDLFSAAAVDELVAQRGLRTPFIRMANEGSVLDSAKFTASGGFGAEITDQVSSDKVFAEFAGGSTIVLQGLHRLWPPIGDFTTELVADLGHPVQVNAYVTPESSRGFDAHYDVHDVFVLQISGEKRWVLHPPVHEHPLSDQPWSDRSARVASAAASAPVLDVVLTPGDALYVPRGWIHSATALGEASVHLTVGMSALNRTDIVDQVVRQLRHDSALRAPLPLGIDLSKPEQLRPIVAETVAAILAHLSRYSGTGNSIAENEVANDFEDHDLAAHDLAAHDLAADDLAADNFIADTIRSGHATAPDAPAPANSTDPVETIVAALAEKLATATRPEPIRPLATMRKLGENGELDAAELVRWRRGLSYDITESDDSISVIAGGKTVSFPALCAPAIRQLLSGNPTPVGALAGLDFDDARVFSRRLIREGFLVLDA